MSTPPSPEHLLKIGLGFMASKTLLSAVEIGLFTGLAARPMTAAQVGDRFALHPRGLVDFLDTLVSLAVLERDDTGADPVYSNGPEAAAFLDRNNDTYVGGLLEMAGHRLYPFWGRLTEALQTGEPQNEASRGEDLFAALYADEGRLEEFLRAMAGVQLGNNHVLAETFEFDKFGSFCDIGGASGALAGFVARRHPHLTCATFDLPAVAPVARRHLQALGLGDRVQVLEGSFFTDPLPRADVLTMGNVLHDWDEAQKVALMRAAYDALPSGGALIAIEMVIDDARRANTMGMLMSLNMLIETPGGFDYTASQFDGWAKQAGFARTEVRPLAGPSSAAIAWKA